MLIFTVTICISMPASAGVALNRIGTRVVNGVMEFYDTVTATTFTPNGYNYTTANDPANNGRHLLFNPGRYDYQKVKALLSELQYFGHNTIRVFINSGNPNHPLPGVGGTYSKTTRGLDSTYMDNFCDFLTRAQNHKIYVIPILDYIAQTQYYISVCNSSIPANVEGENTYLLSQGFINAKKQYVQGFVTYIKTKNSTLLSTILTYELQNEFFVYANQKPFSMTSGTVSPADGGTYDMSNNS